MMFYLFFCRRKKVRVGFLLSSFWGVLATCDHDVFLFFGGFLVLESIDSFMGYFSEDYWLSSGRLDSFYVNLRLMALTLFTVVLWVLLLLGLWHGVSTLRPRRGCS